MGLSLLLGVCALLCLGSAGAFKAEEFKTCEKSGFCNRHRGQTAGTYHVVNSDIQLADGGLAAKLAIADGEVGQATTSVSHHALEWWLLDDCTIRLLSVPTGAYQIPEGDSILHGLAERRVKWAAPTVKGTTIVLSGSCSKGSGASATPSNVQAAISTQPFEITISQDGAVVVKMNSLGQFDIERRRQSREENDTNEMWTEVFRTHTDTKPHGPTAISIDVTFAAANFVYGIPEHATSFALKPTRGSDGPISEPYRLYNLDVFEYLDESPFGLYGSIPFMVGHSASQTSGFFWHNAAEMYIDVLKESPLGHGISTQWIAESGALDLFILPGGLPQDVMHQYAKITGGTELPPLFSIGYHQCRWNYKDEKDVRSVDNGFDEHNIPYDVLWLDIEHTDSKKYMTWDKRFFPNPQAMQADITAKRRRMVTIVDPHVKRDNGYPLHNEATQKGYYVKNKDGKDFEGWCWPGSSSYLDVTSPEVRSWWADKFSLSNYIGSTDRLFIWNDMNEPSVFNGPEVTMQKDNLHTGNVEHRDVHNMYGLYYHMATAQGLSLRSFNTTRPFVLSRAFFAGTQRVGPIWTGDNTADWKHLAVSIPMLLSLGIAGLPFSGADVGGFFGNPDSELMTRWYQLGTYYPFFRGHAHLDTKRREPWLFGEPFTSEIRSAIQERYRLLPYLYTVFWEAHTTGAPIFRPMWYHFPADPQTFEMDHQFMLGSGLLVAPVVVAGAKTSKIYLPPEAQWYAWPDGKRVEPGSYDVPVTLHTVPVYIRGGEIIARRERTRRSTDAMANDPYTLIVAVRWDGNKAHARGKLYLDDGTSFSYKTESYIEIEFTFDGSILASKVLKPSNSFFAKQPIEKIVILGISQAPKAVYKTNEPAIALGAEMGPPQLRADLPSSAVVVKKPGVIVGLAWSISFSW